MESPGHLYGTAAFRGGPNRRGTVFRLSDSARGWELKTLYAFTGRPDGDTPQGSLVLASDGTIYGTTLRGGINWGVFYSLSSKRGQWNETVLYAFGGGVEFPQFGLQQLSELGV
jgi:uncharacterized repeat protein (TIGR03803 family)